MHMEQWLGIPSSSAGKESICNAGDTSLILGSGRSLGGGIGYPLQYSWASLVVQMEKNLPVVWRHGFYPWVGKMPWRRAWPPTPVVLPGESAGTEGPGWLQSMRSQRVGHDWTTKNTAQEHWFILWHDVADGFLRHPLFPLQGMWTKYFRDDVENVESDLFLAVLNI